MGGKPSRPTNGGLFGIHRIITRSISTCADAAEKAGAEGNKWSLADLKDFMYHVFIIVEEHHFHEDEWYFPAWKKHAPEVTPELDKFSADHKQLDQILKDLDALVGPKRKDGVRLPEHAKPTLEEIQKAGKLFAQLREFFPAHLAAEEKLASGPTWDKVPDEVLIELHEKILKHVQADKDSNIRLCINWYMQNEQERAEMFESNLPWIVTSILIPRVWYSQYQHLIPFFAHPPQ